MSVYIIIMSAPAGERKAAQARRQLVHTLRSGGITATEYIALDTHHGVAPREIEARLTRKLRGGRPPPAVGALMDQCGAIFFGKPESAYSRLCREPALHT